MLRGRDIARYRANWADLWLISTFPSLNLDIENFPAIKDHLLSFGKNRLNQSGETLSHGGRARKKTPHQWFELQDTCAYHESFKSEKIFWKQMSKIGTFALAKPGILCNQKAIMITGENLSYLLGVLNSLSISWFVQNTGVTTNFGLLQWDKYIVEKVPIPLSNGNSQKELSEAVHEITHSKRTHHGSSDPWIPEIEDLVFQLYGFNRSEIDYLNSIARSF